MENYTPSEMMGDIMKKLTMLQKQKTTGEANKLAKKPTRMEEANRLRFKMYVSRPQLIGFL